MGNYVIIADSGADIPKEVFEEWGIKLCLLTFMFEGDDREYKSYEMDAKAFYDRMRAGDVAKTAALNMAVLRDAFEEELKKGNDFIYVGFSSGLSSTYNTACLTIQDLQEEYPDRKLLSVDSLCASTGYAMLLYLAQKKKAEGATIEELKAYLDDTTPHLCHWFTVGDLTYLKRGGRVSAVAAFFGGVLDIKPVLHMDIEGHLIAMSKVRGRKQSIKALADKFEELAIDTSAQPVYISHSDCEEDAKKLEEIVIKRFGIHPERIEMIGPVIGAHCGPGTLALYFLGKER